MDSFFDRLGDVLKSFLNDEDDRLFRHSGRSSPIRDPDLDEAYEELNDFLRGDKTGQRKERVWSDPEENQQAWNERNSSYGSSETKKSGIPEALRGDFMELGVSFGADREICKAAYKKLLKIHHPDRHAGHPGNMKKATEKSAKINGAFKRIEAWRRYGRID